MPRPRPARSLPFATALLLLAACTTSATPTPEASTTPEATPAATAPASRTPFVLQTPPPTATPDPVPYVGLYLVDVATEEWHALLEPVDTQAGAYGWWETGGTAITAWTEVDGAYTAYRFALDGSMIEQHPNRLYITPSSDSRSRYYQLYEDGRWTRSVLERDGAEVPIAVDLGFISGFSPAGDRLLVGRGGGEPTGRRVVWTFWVIDVATGDALTEFAGNASPEGTDDLIPPRWAPSGRWIATSGLDGLLVHDTANGATTRLGDGGSTEWAPTEDALVVETDDGRIEIVHLPGLERVPLATEGGRLLGRFGAHGTSVAVRSFLDPDRFQDPIVTVYEAASGRRLARWQGGVDTRTQQFIRFSDGLAGIVLRPTEGCDTFRYYSPLLPEDGHCIDGQNPRLSADGSRIAFFRGQTDSEATLVVYDVATNEERFVGTLAIRGELPLARWNASATHLLVQRSWDGVGFSDELP